MSVEYCSIIWILVLICLSLLVQSFRSSLILGGPQNGRLTVDTTNVPSVVGDSGSVAPTALGHYGDHLCPRVADRGTPSRMVKVVAPKGAADKQCLGEGNLCFQTGADGARLASSGKSI